MRAVRLKGAIVALCVALPLGSCVDEKPTSCPPQLGRCVDETLSYCLGTAEPMVLLRERNLVGAAREMFNECRAPENKFTENFCRSLYVNADTLVRTCMDLRGYTFADIKSGYGNCDLTQYRTAACYQSAWHLRLKAMVRRFAETFRRQLVEGGNAAAP